jgi:toxin ParE1/3/4
MKVTWTRRAFDDRRRIYYHIEEHDPIAAIVLQDVFVNRTKAELPHLGRVGRKSGTRELVVHRHYVVIYDIKEDHIRVLRVLHTARKWPPTHT